MPDSDVVNSKMRESKTPFECKIQAPCILPLFYVLFSAPSE